jgi:hypothetical protein
VEEGRLLLEVFPDEINLTVDITGKVFYWEVGEEVFNVQTRQILADRTGRAISALAYHPSKSWLLTAARARIIVTDIERWSELGTFVQSVKSSKESTNGSMSGPSPPFPLIHIMKI